MVNGGFPQWVFNGYAAWINEVTGAVQQIGTTAAKNVHRILEDVALLASNQIESDQQREENLSKLLECTNRYYSVAGRVDAMWMRGSTRDYDNDRARQHAWLPKPPLEFTLPCTSS